MARNYVQQGQTLTLVAPRTVASGAGILVGALFAVALADAAAGQPVEARRVEVFDLAKATGAWTQAVHNATLTEDLVRKIRAAAGSLPTIASHFGISTQQASRIRLRQRWGWVT